MQIEMVSLLDDVNRLLTLSVGEIGRLNHIQQTLEQNKTLYASDKKYLEGLIEKYLKGKSEDNISQSILGTPSHLDQSNNNPKPYGLDRRGGLHRDDKIILIIIGTFIGLGIVSVVPLFILGILDPLFVVLLYVWAVYGVLLLVLAFAFAWNQHLRNFVRENSN
jgi:hypothetical protein